MGVKNCAKGCSKISIKFEVLIELVVFDIRTSKNNMEYRRHIDFFALEETRTTFQNLHCFKWFLVYCEAAAASIFAGINHCFQEILWQGMLLFIYFPKKLMRTHAMSIDQSKRFFEFSSMTFLYQDGVGLFQLLLYA